ncbi:ABC transporter ATP-binding protein [Clostridium nigeriense]|uniref:ABC transporter ATP-binding protein n=1 Tax=Clostridium nigeriense TaxID=1805470 RepID=UPI003D335739
MSKSQYIIKNVTKSYEVNNEKHIVLKNISLNINTNDITVILGESGCGKTTLLRLIANIENVSSGEIKFIRDNKEVKPKVGFVFQESRLMPWLNVCENIAFNDIKNKTIMKGLKNIVNFKKDETDNYQVDIYLRMMKLEKFKNSYPYELSGGMAQRVSIARALYFDPDVLLMDEPFSALDYFTRADMQNELIRIHKSTKKGVIFVTHDIDEALKLANRIIVFERNNEIKEFEIEESHDKNFEDEYYINLKREILKTLNYNITNV